MTYIGEKGWQAVYGIPNGAEDPKEVVYHDGIEPGKLRWRFRNTDIARVFVKTATCVRHFVPFFDGEKWHIFEEMEQGVNCK